MATIVNWDTGNPTTAGGIIGGAPTFVTADSGFEWAVIPTSDSTVENRIRWDTAATATYTTRYYLGVPRLLDPAAPSDFYRSSVSGTQQVQHTWPPGSEQGSLRLKGSGNVVVDTVPVGTLAPGDVVRVETQVNGVSGVRFALFRLGADVPFFDSGVIADAAQVAATRHSFGHHANTPAVGPWAISRIRVDDTAAGWIGRHSSDVRAAVAATIVGTT